MTPDEQESHLAMQSERRHLVSLAYQVLGTVTAAEEAVQETYLRWYRLTADEQARVGAPRAWLTRTLSRVCLHSLASAQHPKAHGTRPVLRSASAAMTPAERISLLLHDGFAMEFDEVAEVVGSAPDTCRRLARSARHRVELGRAQRQARAQRDDFIRTFIAAARRLDIAALIDLLDPCARVRTVAAGADFMNRAPIIGAREVAWYLIHPLQANSDTTILEQETANGLGFALWQDGCIAGVATVDVAESTATAIRVSLSPDRSAVWT